MSKLKKIKFCDLYEMSSGISSKPEQAGHGSPFLSFSTVFNNYFLPNDLPDLMDISESEKIIYSIKEGDIFLTRTSETLDELAMSSVAVKDYLEASFSGFLKRLRPTQNDITYHKFMAFYLRSNYFRKTMNNNAIMTLRASFNEQIFSYINLYLPEFKEQKKIGDFLFSINQKIELNNKINSELEAMAKLIYDYWFVQFDFPNEQGSPYKTSSGKMVWNEELKREVPEGWEVKSLFDIADFINGLACQKYRPLNDEDESLPVIKIKEMNEGLSENTERVRIDIPEKHIINDGDVLFSWSATLDVKIWNQGKGALNQHIFKISSQKFPKSFYYFEILNYLQHFKMMAELRKTTMGHITKEHLLESRICVPSLKIISRIDKILSPIFQKLLLNAKQNQELSNLRDWLLPMLMNGQVNVGVAQLKKPIVRTRTDNDLRKAKEPIKKVKENLKYNNELYLALIVASINNKLNINYGEVAIQKTVFNAKAFDPSIANTLKQYEFINSNYGTYSWELKNDLKKNPFLIKKEVRGKEIFTINPKSKKQIESALNAKENKSFIKAINKVLSIYEHSIINKATDQIELLNTVTKLVLDLKTTNLNKIYKGMEKWEIKQKGFKTKADKFSKEETEKMLGLMEKKGLVEILL